MTRPRRRQHLVVIGNGMAGARAVEEILERGGGAQFRITMFGDEPYGNYNRIMLSHVLAGDGQRARSTSTRWTGTPRTTITLHAGVRVVRVDRFAKKVFGNDGTIESYDKLIIATGSRTFFPPMDGMWVDDKTLTPGVFGFRTLDDTTAMLDYAAERRTAVVIGGGLLGLEAAYGLMQHGHEVHVVQSGPVLMNQQLDEEAGGILRKVLERHGHARSTRASGPPRSAAHGGGVSAVVFKDGSAIDCDMVVVTAGIRPNVGLGVVSGLTVERAIVTDDQMRSVDDPDIYAVGECAQHRGEVYGLVAPLWEQAVVLADHLTGVEPEGRLPRLADRDEAQGRGRRRGGDGGQGPRAAGRRVRPVRRAQARRLQVGGHPRRQAGRRDAARRHQEGRVPDPELRPRAAAARGARRAAVRARRADRGAGRGRDGRLGAGLQLQRRVQGRPRRVRARRRAQRHGLHERHPGGQGLRGVQAAGQATSSSGRSTESGGEVGVDESANWYVPAIPMDKPTLIAAIKEQNLRSVSAVLAALAPDGEDAGSKMPLTSLLRVVWNGEFVNENDAKFINDRVHANIQRDGTFSVVPQIKGGVTDRRRAAPDRRRRRQVRRSR